MKRVYLFFLFTFIRVHTFSQIDTAFWFVAPNVSNHGSYDLDRPIYLRLSTHALPSTITVSQPANPSFVPITVNLSACSSQSVDLTPFLGTIENMPTDQVLNYGLHIRGTNVFSAYYEVLGGISSCNTCNPELFSLKGKNALGTNFYIPLQQTYQNNYSYLPLPYSAFDIVATENGTVVTINPTKNIVGHAAGIPFNINLNKGQTFSCTASSQAAAEHPSGSTVTANKPIAITVTDDLVWFTNPNGGTDLMGDQLIPVNRVGSEYVIVKSPSSTKDLAIIVGTQNSTQVNVNGSLVTTINTGQSYQYDLSIAGTAAIYISTSNPAYVLQITSSSTEFGAAVLPSLVAAGSTEVSVTRSTNKPFYVILITPSGNQGNFLFNGNAGVILGSSFQPVPGAGNWVYALIDLSTSAVIGSANIVSNIGGLFQMGLFVGTVEGSGYGYFSDFTVYDYGVTQNICSGNSLILTANVPNATYTWNTGASTDNITINAPGNYWVRSIIGGGCMQTDTFIVTNISSINLGNDTSYCSAFSHILNTHFANTVWSTGITDSVITVNSAGIYWASATDNCGTFSDTIQIFQGQPATFNLGNDTSYCGNFSQTLSTGNQNALWSTGVTASQITVNTAGTYWAEINNGCGTVDDSITLVQNMEPQFTLGSDTSLCTGDVYALTIDQSPSINLWSDGSANTSLSISQAGVYWLQITTPQGCTASDSVVVSYLNTPTPFSLGADTSYCNNTSFILSTGNANTLWSTGITASQITVNTSGIYWAEISNQCGTERDSISIQQLAAPSIDLGSDTILCSNQPYTLSVASGFDSYLWNDGSAGSSLIANGQGLYWVEVSQNGCSSRDSILIGAAAGPQFTLGSDTTVCGNELLLSLNLGNVQYHWQDNATDSIYYVTGSGTYSVTVSNSCGSSTDAVKVEIHADECALAVPTAFSPNGDGKNDVFRGVSRCATDQYLFRVFNRWGEMVYETENVSDGWNGTFRNTAQPVSVYVYYYQYFNYCENKLKKIAGNVSLIR